MIITITTSESSTVTNLNQNPTPKSHPSSHHNPSIIIIFNLHPNLYIPLTTPLTTLKNNQNQNPHLQITNNNNIHTIFEYVDLNSKTNLTNN
jgi:hypothetical protein